MRIGGLAIADGIVLFARGNLGTVQVLWDSSQNFQRCLDRWLMPRKKKKVFCGVDEVDQEQIIAVTGCSKGSFLFGYLGLPLSSRRSTHSMCQPLIDKI